MANKITLLKTKDKIRVYDLTASIFDNSDLVLSECYYYPRSEYDAGREYEYYITIPFEQRDRLLKIFNEKYPTVVSNDEKDKVLLSLLAHFCKSDEFTNLRDMRNWLETHNITYEYSTY